MGPSWPFQIFKLNLRQGVWFRDIGFWARKSHLSMSITRRVMREHKIKEVQKFMSHGHPREALTKLATSLASDPASVSPQIACCVIDSVIYSLQHWHVDLDLTSACFDLLEEICRHRETEISTFVARGGFTVLTKIVAQDKGLWNRSSVSTRATRIACRVALCPTVAANLGASKSTWDFFLNAYQSVHVLERSRICGVLTSLLEDTNIPNDPSFLGDFVTKYYVTTDETLMSLFRNLLYTYCMRGEAIQSGVIGKLLHALVTARSVNEQLEVIGTLNILAGETHNGPAILRADPQFQFTAVARTLNDSNCVKEYRRLLHSLLTTNSHLAAKLSFLNRKKDDIIACAQVLDGSRLHWYAPQRGSAGPRFHATQKRRLPPAGAVL